MKWEEVKLGDICTNIISGGTPLSNRDDFYYPEEIPWLKTKEVNYKRIYNVENYISEEGLNNSSAKLIPVNSVIVAMYGQGDTAGRVGINKIPLCTNQACCNLIVDESKANYNYVYYYLTNSYQKLVSLKNGGAQPNLNVGMIKNFKIHLPNLAVQHKISSILSAYDDLVENNQNQIKLLEEAAQRLYKEWFVDLRFPGYEAVEIVAGLPKGWQTGTLGELMEFGSGKTKPEKGYLYPVYGGNGILDYCDLYNKENIIVIGRVGAYCGSVHYEIGKCWISDNALYAVSKDGCRCYYYYLLKNLNLNARHVGTGQPLLTQRLLSEIETIIVHNDVLQKFEDVVSKFVKLQYELTLQNKRLVEARDRLLPKLMSGEVEVW